MKNDKFQPIMHRFGKRCNDWNERFMSQAAKEVKLKLLSKHCQHMSWECSS